MSLLLLLQLWPLASGLVINGALLGIGLYAHRVTGMRGWRLIALASALRVAMTAPWAYGQYVLRANGPSAYGRMMMWLSGAEMAVSLVCSLLMIGALLLIVDECRRLAQR